MKALVVDDNRPFRQLLARILATFGHTVETARSGNEAIALLEDGTVDVALVDIFMADGDGLEVLMFLRSRSSPVRVIAMSDPSNEIFLRSARAMGAVTTLLKPFGLDTLEHALEAVSSPN